MSVFEKLTNFLCRVFGHSTPQVLVKLIKDDKRLMPTKAHWDDSGYDIRSAEDQVLTVAPGGTMSVRCGFAIELPIGYEAQVRSRSGLALKHQIAVLNSPGTIDNGYRGEIKVIVTNFGSSEFKIRYGDRIAQLVVCHIPDVAMIQSKKLHESGRNENGFGSTGVNEEKSKS